MEQRARGSRSSLMEAADSNSVPDGTPGADESVASGDFDDAAATPVETTGESQAPRQTLSEFPAAGERARYREADVVSVPPALEPTGDEPLEDPGLEDEQDSEPAVRSGSSRGHGSRLDAASVLDAPASLHESVSPPARGSWMLYLWMGLMLAIISAAVVVALRESKAERDKQILPKAGVSAPQDASGEALGPAPERGKEVTTSAPPQPATPARGADARGVEIEEEKAVIKVAPQAESAPTSASEISSGAASAPSTSSSTPDAPDSARARRAARRAAEAAATATGSTPGSVRSSDAARPAENAQQPSSAAEVRPNSEAVRDPRSAASQIPGNPYESEEARGLGAR